MRAAILTMLGVALALLSTCTAVVSAPGVEIAAPEDGATAEVGETLQVLVIVSPDLEASSVVALCDDKGIGMAQAPPYAFQWNTAGLEPGGHLLRAFAYLKSGEKVGAEPVTVTLSAPPRPATRAIAAAPSDSVAPVTLKDGTPVLLKTTEKLVSGRVAEGSTVRYEVVRDVVAPDRSVLIAYGGTGQGKVTRSRRRGMFGKAGQLEFTIDTVEAVDGTTVPLRSQQAIEGKGNKNEVIISTLLLSVFAVFVHGRDVEIPEGTELTAYVDHDTVIQQPQAATPGGVVRGEPLEDVRVTSPVEGTNVRIGSPISVEVQVTPSNKFRSLKVILDSRDVASQDGTLGTVSIPTRGLARGQHPIAVEVTFTNGRTIRSAPVMVELVQ